MQSMSSQPSLLPSNRPDPSLWRRLLLGLRTRLLRIFLPIAAALALPSLGIGALIWWRTSKTWDYRERWAGTWVLAIAGLVVYAALTWFAHPLPSLFHALLVERRESILVASLRAVGKLWLLHLCFAPACALILEWLHPLTRRVRWLARSRVPRRGQAGGALPDHSSASALPLVATPPHSTSASPLNRQRFDTPLQVRSLSSPYRQPNHWEPFWVGISTSGCSAVNCVCLSRRCGGTGRWWVSQAMARR